MESIRLRLAITVAVFMLLSTLLLSWYGNFDKIDISSTSEKTYMSNEWKVRTYGATGVDDYETYYVTYVTKKKTRTLIPLVYNHEILSKKYGQTKDGSKYVIEREK